MIYEIDGYDLREILSELESVVQQHQPIRILRIDVRSNGVSIKINERMWSAPMGRPVERS